MHLRLSRTLSTDDRLLIRRCSAGIPLLVRRPIYVSAKPELTAFRGKLLSEQPHRGKPVHAASYIRRHRIVLERDLLSDETLLRLILTHELFHFLWPRLPNRLRQGFEAVLIAERNRHARGELGESSQVSKFVFLAGGSDPESKAWRHYICESFCDTAAWYFGGVKKHPHFCLAPCWIRRRSQWFEANLRRYTVR